MANARQDEKARAMYQNYQSGMSLAEVGRKWAVTRQSVHSSFSRRRLPLRQRQLLLSAEFNGVKFTMRNTGYLGRTDGNRELMHRYVWRYHNGDIPPGYDIHHRNHNRTDNRIENLELLSKSEHARRYATRCNGTIHRCGK